MDRRQFLATGSAAALTVPFVSSPLLAAPAAVGSGDAALNTLFESIFQEQVRTNPVSATYAGLDKGELAGLKSKLDTRPDRQARVEEIARTNNFIASLEAVDAATLSSAAALNREVVIWDLKTGNVGPERFDIANPQGPYDISQQDGAYFSTRTSSTARTRSRRRRTPKPISRGCRVRDRDRQQTAEQQRAGGARLPRARLVARPGARPDAPPAQEKAAASSSRVAFQPRDGQEYRRAIGAAALPRSSTSRSTLRSTGRSPRSLRSGRRARPATASGGCRTATTFTRPRSSEATTTSYSAGRSPSARTSAGRRDQRRAGQDP